MFIKHQITIIVKTNLGRFESAICGKLAQFCEQNFKLIFITFAFFYLWMFLLLLIYYILGSRISKTKMVLESDFYGICPVGDQRSRFFDQANFLLFQNNWLLVIFGPVENSIKMQVQKIYKFFFGRKSTELQAKVGELLSSKFF